MVPWDSVGYFVSRFTRLGVSRVYTRNFVSRAIDGVYGQNESERLIRTQKSKTSETTRTGESDHQREGS